MADAPAPAGRCGIDTVEIAGSSACSPRRRPRISRKLFSAQELADAGDGPGRAASLAARFAAKEACVKLFPREAALGQIEPADFSVARDNYGAPRLVCGPRAAELLARHRIASIAVSLTHDRVSASAVAQAERASVAVPLAGRFLFRFLPLRRSVILANLRRVYGETLSGARDRDAGAGALRPPVAAPRRIPALPVAVGRAKGGAGAHRERRGVRRRAAAGQRRARAHRSFRQLGSGDDRRPRPLSGLPRPLPFRPPRDQAGAGSMRSSRGASTRRASASSASAARSTGSSTCWPPAT